MLAYIHCLDLISLPRENAMSLRVLKIGAMLLLLSMTQACGQKGGLYHPDEPSSALASPQHLA